MKPITILNKLNEEVSPELQKEFNIEDLQDKYEIYIDGISDEIYDTRDEIDQFIISGLTVLRRYGIPVESRPTVWVGESFTLNDKWDTQIFYDLDNDKWLYKANEETARGFLSHLPYSDRAIYKSEDISDKVRGNENFEYPLSDIVVYNTSSGGPTDVDNNVYFKDNSIQFTLNRTNSSIIVDIYNNFKSMGGFYVSKEEK